MHEDRSFLWPIIGGLVVTILFCSVMLVRGTGEKRYQVSVIVSDSSQDRWVPLKAGLTQAARDNNIDLSYVYTDYIDDVFTQTALINQEIADGADGIITDFCLSMGTADIVRNIIARVPVEFIITNVDADADISGNYATVMTDNVEVGRAIGNELVIDYGDRLKGMKIGIIAGNQQQYAAYLSRRLGIRPDETFDVLDRLPELLQAMARFESGREWDKSLFLPYSLISTAYNKGTESQAVHR